MGGGKGGFGKSNQGEAKAEQKMRDAEEQIRDRMTERLLLFDKDGNVLHTIDGIEDHVDYDDEAKRLFKEGLVKATSHNHPVAMYEGQVIEDCPFSPEDLQSMVLHANEEVSRVVSKNMTFVLRRLADPNANNKSSGGRSLFGASAYKSPWKKDRADFHKDYNSFMARAENRAFSITERLCRSGKLPMTDEAYVSHSVNLMVGMYRKWLSNHAKDYGYEYSEYRRK